MRAVLAASAVLTAGGILGNLRPGMLRAVIPSPGQQRRFDAGGQARWRSARLIGIRSPLVRPMLIAVGMLLTIVVVGPLVPVAALAGVFGSIRVRRLIAERKRQRALVASLPDAVDTFVLLAGTGLSMRLAVAEMARRGPTTTRPAFQSVMARLNRGEPFAEALHALTNHIGSAAAPLVELIGSAVRNGVPLGAALAQLGSETRAMRRRLDEAAARALPVKLSFPLVVCTLPSFVLLAIAPAVMAALSSLGTDTW